MPQRLAADDQGLWLPWTEAITITVALILVTLVITYLILYRGWHRVIIGILGLYWLVAGGFVAMNVDARAQAQFNSITGRGSARAWFKLVTNVAQNDPAVFYGAVLTAIAIICSFLIFRKDPAATKEVVRRIITGDVKVDDIMDGLLERCSLWFWERKALRHHVISY